MWERWDLIVASLTKRRLASSRLDWPVARRPKISTSRSVRSGPDRFTKSESYLDLLELTLQHGADVRSLDSHRATALIRAAGANPSLADGEGVTPLQHAIDHGYGEIATLLRNVGAR